MANTVSILSYANTFGDWVVTTNAVVRENNDFAANNYTKPTGTLYLNDPTLGLQVANNAIVAGQLQVQGVGSSAYVQNNLRVDNQLYLQNTTLSLVASGQANIGGPLLALSSGTGLAVSNNATVGGTLNVYNTSTLSNTDIVGSLTVSENSTLTGNVRIVDSVSVGNDIFTRNIKANTLLTVPTANILADASIWGSATVYGQLAVGGNFTINGTTVYNTNNFTISAATSSAVNSTFTVNRGVSGANASIRWSESSKYFDILNVDSGQYFRILTNEHFSNSLTSNSTSNVATSNAVFSLNNNLNSANTWLQANDVLTLTTSRAYTDASNTSLRSYTDNAINTANTNLRSYTDNAINTANTNLKSYTDNLVNATITSLSNNINAANTNAANASYLATGNVPAARVSGNYPNVTGVGTITSGTWSASFGSVSGATLTNLTAGNLTGTIPSTVLGNSSVFIGTSAVALNRASGSLALTGVSIDGNAGSASSVAWTNVSGRPTAVSAFTNDSGYLISSGTIQNANYASSYNINYSNRSNSNYQILWGSGAQAYGTDLLFLNPSSGALYSYNNITAYYSDDRLKTRLGNIESALDKVSQLNGFLYVQNEVAESFGYQETGTQVGVSAQEVQKVQPEAVKLAAFDVADDGTSKSGENYLTVQYDKLVPLLIEAIKELKAEVEELKKK